MGELINTHRKSLRGQLRATASALALFNAVCGGSEALAENGNVDRPTVWIELGGQWSRLNESQEVFSPPLMAGRPSDFAPSGEFEHLPLSSVDGSGKLSIAPQGTDWMFSASVRYGRSNSNRHIHQQSHPDPLYRKKYRATYTATNVYQPLAARFADTVVQNSASHLVVDFQAGKDVGLGIFGKQSDSVLNIGVRFAQFGAKSNVTLKSDPDWRFGYKYLPFGFPSVVHQYYHSNQAHLMAQRGFHGIGPSLSWNSSVPLMGDQQEHEVTVDWGLNGAILFGRQKTRLDSQITERYHAQPSVVGTAPGKNILYQTTIIRNRDRSVVVPNIGGSLGLSFRYTNAKVSFGYRADLFIGAMDGGIETAKRENVGFFGPFASVSIGLGG